MASTAVAISPLLVKATCRPMRQARVFMDLRDHCRRGCSYLLAPCKYFSLGDQRGGEGGSKVTEIPTGLTAISEVQPAPGCVQIVVKLCVLSLGGEDGQAWWGSP